MQVWAKSSLPRRLGERRHRVAEVELQALHEVGVVADAFLGAGQHVGRVVGHQVAHAPQVVAPLLLARGSERVQPHLRALAVAHAELQHVDLLGQLGPLLEAVQRGHEGVDPVGPERGVGAVGDPAGQGGGVVLAEGLVPRPQMAPVAAIERPRHALARPYPVLEVGALVDVGHEPERLGEAVDDLGAQRRPIGRARAPHVDGDLGQRLVAAPVARAAHEGAHHHGRAEVLAVLDPVEYDGQPRVIEVDRGGDLAQRRQDRREVVGLRPSDGPQLDDHRLVSLARPDAESAMVECELRSRDARCGGVPLPPGQVRGPNTSRWGRVIPTSKTRACPRSASGSPHRQARPDAGPCR